MSDTYLYRAFSLGTPIGGLMNAHEIIALIASIRSNAAAGLADPCELTIERLDSGGWRPHAVIDEWEPTPVFSNPVAMSGGDDG